MPLPISVSERLCHYYVILSVTAPQMPLIFPPCSFWVLGSYLRCHIMLTPHVPLVSSGLWQVFRIPWFLWPWQFWDTLARCFIEHTTCGGVWWFSHNGIWTWGTKATGVGKICSHYTHHFLHDCISVWVWRGLSVTSINFEFNSSQVFNSIFLLTFNWYFFGQIRICGRRVETVGTGDFLLCFNSVCVLFSGLGWFLPILVWWLLSDLCLPVPARSCLSVCERLPSL